MLGEMLLPGRWCGCGDESKSFTLGEGAGVDIAAVVLNQRAAEM